MSSRRLNVTTTRAKSSFVISYASQFAGHAGKDDLRWLGGSPVSYLFHIISPPKLGKALYLWLQRAESLGPPPSGTSYPKQMDHVQAQEVDYALHTLGWKAFQELCVTIAGEILGQTVQSFLPSSDGGRDGAFFGEWKPTTGTNRQGSFTIQCKFTARPNRPLTLNNIKEELDKAAKLGRDGLAQHYFLMTNHGLSGVADARIRKAFLELPGIETCTIFGTTWITQKIRESPRLRMLVPRVYGLGDLSQILDARKYDQAREILSSISDDLAKFVITDAYLRSARALAKHGFVMLLGEPASGKSMIAACLALAALDQWSCSTIKVADPSDFDRHSNPNEARQFFWVDDAFGGNHFEARRANAWNQLFPNINAAIKRGAKVIFTSRDYIYQSAKSVLKRSALPIMQEAEVVIRVQKLSLREKQQILYNHIRLGSTALREKISRSDVHDAVIVSKTSLIACRATTSGV